MARSVGDVTPAPANPAGRPLTRGEQATGVRHSMGLLALLGALVTLVPGIAVYVGLRAAGLGIGGAGLIGLVLEFAGCFAYCGWLFSGGKRR